MKKIKLTVFLLMAYCSAHCQGSPPPRVSFSAYSLFQAFKVPFASLDTYLKNKGLSIAATYDLSGKSTFQQSVELGYFFNRFHGNTYMLSSSTSFNPIHSKVFNAFISLGAGYMNSGFREGGWEQTAQGEWITSSNRKANLFIPADLHVQFKIYENNQFVLSPVLDYQINALINYSHASTVLPQSFFKAGLNLTIK